MDELIMPILLVLLFSLLGWLLGVAGFFKARRALAELASLRAALAKAGLDMAAMRPLSPWEQAAAQRAAPEPAMADAPNADAPLAASEPPEDTPPPALPHDWEELLTAKWGVWLGAAALLLSGVFLVRYAVDEGLLGPPVRCAAMVLLGAALIAGAEWLRRRARGPADLADRAPAALAAGSVGILFAAAYMAGALYELVPPLAGFALMAAAALAGLALSLRFGQMVAALGIVGAFATPLLVQTQDPSLPGLFGYLLCVTGAALAVLRYAGWVWLGWATTIAGALWVLAAMGATASGDLWAAALFVPAAALLNVALLPGVALDTQDGRWLAWIPVAALGAAGLLLAYASPEFATRAGVLLLAPICIGKAATEPRLAPLPWLAAVLFMLLILGWGLPPWHATGEVITTEDAVLAILPGAWAPDILRPLLETAALMAGLFALAGLWFERRAAQPLGWSALAAAVPVLTLALLYLRVKQFQPDDLWAFAALALAVAGTAAAALAINAADRRRAGAHAAGATASLALGCAMLLSAQWLTLAFALFLPPLAWIAARAELPALRRVALAVACVALVRLLLNPFVLTYAALELPVLNDRLPVFLAAAAAFAVAAWMFRQRGDDLTVAVLELGSVAFTTALVMLEIRQWATGGVVASPDFTFREVALQISALAVLAAATQHLAARTERETLGWAWRIQGALALAGAAMLIVLNPAFLPTDSVGSWPVLNALLPAYALPAALAAWMASRGSTSGGITSPAGFPPSLRPVLAAYVLLAVFAWISLEIRHVFHPSAMAMTDAPIEDSELWAWSGAWLAYGLALMALGIVRAQKSLRLAALALVGLTAAKVFLIDMDGLVGLWRVLSFLGLGLVLIGLGATYRRFVAVRPI